MHVESTYDGLCSDLDSTLESGRAIRIKSFWFVWNPRVMAIDSDGESARVALIRHGTSH